MNDTPHPSSSATANETASEVAQPGTELHIAVAPGLLDQEQVLLREQGESDESFQSRCELLADLLDYAKRQG